MAAEPSGADLTPGPGGPAVPCLQSEAWDPRRCRFPSQPEPRPEQVASDPLDLSLPH